MARALLTACLLAVLAATAAADKVQLSDGRSLIGVVTVEGDSVQIVMEYGTIRVNRSEVVSIEMGDTPEMELAKKLSAAPPDNAAAIGEIAQWAADNNLPRQADELYNKVLRLEPNHPAARAALDFAWIEGEWRTFAQGLERARNKLEAGQVQNLPGEVLSPLEALAHTPERQTALHEMSGLAMLRGARFSAATKVFEDLAAKAAGPVAIRYGATAEVLRENPDGMYILSEPFPPASELLGDPQTAMKPGPASLTDPRVLQAALADRAKKDIQAARQGIEEVRKAGDPEAARVKGAQAARSLDRAEALAPGIGRSYRVELVRLHIESLRREVDRQAKDFDKESAALGKSDLPPPAYRAKIQKLVSLLDVIRDDLKEVLEVSKPYPRDLLLDVKWAELDLKRIQEMRDVLTGELDARK